MGRRNDTRARRRLTLKRETVRAISAMDLARVAGGTFSDTTWDCPTMTCDTSDCWYTMGSRYC